MIKVVLIGLRRDETIVNENSTIREVLEKNGLLQGGRSYSLNLREVPVEALDTTFAENGVREGQSCTLTSIAQKNNA